VAGRERERAAVDALDEPLGGELAQVAPDRVLRDAEVLDQAGGHDLPLPREQLEDRAAALGAEEGCTFLHERAGYCVVLRFSTRRASGAGARA
jgi:hypothetical protein